MKKLRLEKLLYAGVEPSDDDSARVSTVFINFLAMAMTVVSVIFFWIMEYFDFKELSTVCLFLVFCYPVMIYLNHIGKKVLAGYYFVAIIFPVMFYFSWYLGPHSQMHFSYIALGILGFAIFRENRLKHGTIVQALSTALLLIYQYLTIVNPDVGALEKNSTTTMFSGFVTIVISVMFAFANIFIASKQIALEKKLVKESSNRLRLLRIFSHDLRNIMMVGHGGVQYLKLLQKKSPVPQYEKMIDRMGRSYSSMNTLTESIMNYLKSSSGDSTEDTLEAVLVTDIFSEAEFTLAEKASEKGVALRFENSVQDLSVDIQKVFFIHSVLNNYISNAIKFSSEGDIITVSADPLDTNEAKFSIIDHGVGMTREKIEQTFQGRTSSSTNGTKGEAGSGFGMLIAYQILSNMGGKLQVTSRCKEEYPDSHGTQVILKVKRSAEKHDSSVNEDA